MKQAIMYKYHQANSYTRTQGPFRTGLRVIEHNAMLNADLRSIPIISRYHQCNPVCELHVKKKSASGLSAALCDDREADVLSVVVDDSPVPGENRQ